ncbi:MAG: hypothetical protein II631_04750 [Treponema sp.]|nr:hypothetical protein [Treponema sp.]
MESKINNPILGGIIMARTANYEQKIENITAKIEKKSEEIKALKAQLADLEAKKTRTDFKVLNEYLVNKGIAPEEALGKLKEVYGE